jgi:transposase-like protein
VVGIAGKKHWLWRAVDQDGYVLDEIVQSRRNTKAAKRLLTRLLQKRFCRKVSARKRLAAIGSLIMRPELQIAQPVTDRD